MVQEDELRHLRVALVLTSEIARFHAKRCFDPARKDGFDQINTHAVQGLAPHVAERRAALASSKP